MLNTARVKVSLLARPKVSCVSAVLPVPPLTVAWPDGFAFNNPLPLEEVKLTNKLFWPTVPVTVRTSVAGLSRTLSVPWLLTPVTTTISALAVPAETVTIAKTADKSSHFLSCFIVLLFRLVVSRFLRCAGNHDVRGYCIGAVSYTHLR